jgi:hypothetical protein
MTEEEKILYLIGLKNKLTNKTLTDTITELENDIVKVVQKDRSTKKLKIIRNNTRTCYITINQRQKFTNPKYIFTFPRETNLKKILKEELTQLFKIEELDELVNLIRNLNPLSELSLRTNFDDDCSKFNFSDDV